MKIELTRFKVESGKTERVDEWMTFLKDNLPAVLETLEREKMYVETIFREKNGEAEYLYWYSIQATDGKSVQTSEHFVDKKHLEFWKECIDSNVVPVDLNTELTLIPDSIKSRMK